MIIEGCTFAIMKKTMSDKLHTPQDGWTKERLSVLGVPWPPPKGWKKKLEREMKEQERTMKEQRSSNAQEGWQRTFNDPEKRAIWIETTRRNLLNAVTKAEAHTEECLKQLPIQFHKECPVVFIDNIWFMDFLVTSMEYGQNTVPCAISIEIDGDSHYKYNNIVKDTFRNICIVAFGEAKVVLRIENQQALRMTPDGWMKILRSANTMPPCAINLIYPMNEMKLLTPPSVLQSPSAQEDPLDLSWLFV